MGARSIVSLGLACVFAVSCERGNARIEHVRIGNHHWDLELALDDAAIRNGLMDRTDIPAGPGTLFVFQAPGLHEFWMANCLVDLDLIFLDGQARITTLYTMKAEPPRGRNESIAAYERRLPLYSSRVPVRFAIELPAGSIHSLGLRAGQAVELDTARLKSLAH